MKQFDYRITDEIGIHARPAGQLVKEAKKFSSRITVIRDGKSIDATKLMALMGLGVKHGECITVTAEGEDEETAIESMEIFFKENL